MDVSVRHDDGCPQKRAVQAAVSNRYPGNLPQKRKNLPDCHRVSGAVLHGAAVFQVLQRGSQRDAVEGNSTANQRDYRLQSGFERQVQGAAG